MPCTYILYSPIVDRYYVGSTSNFDRSLDRHNSGKNRHTKSGIPWNPVYKSLFESMDAAKEMENKIKSSLSREELLQFIKSKQNEIKGG